MTIRPPDPARDRRTIKVQDRRYKETQLYILQQCTPVETYGPRRKMSRLTSCFVQ